MYKALVKALRSHNRNNLEYWLDEAADAIEELVGKVEQLPRWIPVTERLPEPYVNVLAFDGEDVGIAYYQKKSQYWLPDWMFDDACVDVTHWMPLPEPPKEEQP